MEQNETPPLAVVVEDDPSLGDIFTQALQFGGFTVNLITDGQQALDKLVDLTPHVIVLDLHLPYVSGDKVLEFVRKSEHLSETIVILATADAQFADSIRAQADLVLLKPISFNQLKDLAIRLNVNH